jgi:hypothetical protein
LSHPRKNAGALFLTILTAAKSATAKRRKGKQNDNTYDDNFSNKPFSALMDVQLWNFVQLCLAVGCEGGGFPCISKSTHARNRLCPLLKGAPAVGDRVQRPKNHFRVRERRADWKEAAGQHARPVGAGEP